MKTRLIPLLGPDGAAALHAGLVRHALSTATQARLGPVQLWCAPSVEHPFFDRCRSDFGVTLHRQEGADLGERMRHAFAEGLAAGAKVVMIGSDCPALGAADLQAASSALDMHAVVIAPAEDGGYVLIALRQPQDALFTNIAWGTAAVWRETRARLEAAGIAWTELPMRWDVDRPEDYARLRAEGRLAEVMS